VSVVLWVSTDNRTVSYVAAVLNANIQGDVASSSPVVPYGVTEGWKDGRTGRQAKEQVERWMDRRRDGHDETNGYFTQLFIGENV
jgi:hypothetical protein